MTATDIVATNGTGMLTGDQVDLIKRTIAKDATDDELQLFIAQCNRTHLDPFSHQIWFTKRQGKMSIQTGIDGYRLIGERTGRRAGSEAFWCAADGEWKDVWLSSDKPAAAKVTVRKLLADGSIATETGIALWAEYGVNADGFMWKKMPAAQLAKCAEALALRKAFPAELSGLYTSDEMDQADKPAAAPREQRPALDPQQTVRKPPGQPEEPTVVEGTGEIIDAEVVETDDATELAEAKSALTSIIRDIEPPAERNRCMKALTEQFGSPASRSLQQVREAHAIAAGWVAEPEGSAA